jgi:hypothetical protein
MATKIIMGVGFEKTIDFLIGANLIKTYCFKLGAKLKS